VERGDSLSVDARLEDDDVRSGRGRLRRERLRGKGEHDRPDRRQRGKHDNPLHDPSTFWI
jgi:hypothetical protein